MRDEVRGACELLGLDPLHIANEGQLVAVVAADSADRALAALRGVPGGESAALVGRVERRRRERSWRLPARRHARSRHAGRRSVAADLLEAELNVGTTLWQVVERIAKSRGSTVKSPSAQRSHSSASSASSALNVVLSTMKCTPEDPNSERSLPSACRSVIRSRRSCLVGKLNGSPVRVPTWPLGFRTVAGCSPSGRRRRPFSVACVQSFAKIVALTNTRHFLVHGVVTGYDLETGTLKFTKPELIEDKTLQMMNELKITGHQLAQQSIEWETANVLYSLSLHMLLRI